VHGCVPFYIQHTTWASMGRNIKARKKLTPIQIMINVGLNNKNSVDNVNIDDINSNFME